MDLVVEKESGGSEYAVLDRAEDETCWPVRDSSKESSDRSEEMNIKAEKIDELGPIFTCETEFSGDEADAAEGNTNNNKTPVTSNKAAVEKERRFQCDLCGRAFTHRSYLKVHTRTHTGEKPFQCKICAKAFAQSSILISHMRTHTGLKPFPCHICHKAFSQIGHRNDHERRHSGLKPYACDICEKTFTQKTTLRKHIALHAGIRKYECQQCKRRFVRRTDLNCHSFTHTGVKPYGCQICPKSFTRKHHVTRHMKNVHQADVRDIVVNDEEPGN